MKLRHFETLRPVCPVCQTHGGEESPLSLGRTFRGDDDAIVEGTVECTNQQCLHEFPIIDGIPLLLPDARAYVANNIHHLGGRNDLSGEIENLLGECCGPGSSLDATRLHLSNYAWEHYAEFDPAETGDDPAPGSMVRALQEGLSLIEGGLEGPILDAGCSVGRSTFELARRHDGPVLGIDTNYSMLRLAASALRRGVVRYPRRRLGLVYETREFPVCFDNAANVDFWACDATALPFPPGAFRSAVSLNVLDCVGSPLDLLRSLRHVLVPGARLLLAAPYDWSGAVTAPEAWVGGHSPRSPGHGASEAVLRALLTPGAHAASVAGLRLTAELDGVPWRLRIHDRSFMTYRLHVVAALAEPLS